MNEPVKEFDPKGTKSEYKITKIVVRFNADLTATPTFSWVSYKCRYSRSFYKGKEEIGTQTYEYGVSLTPYGSSIPNTGTVKSGPNTIIKMTPKEAEESVEFNHIKLLKPVEGKLDLLFDNLSQLRTEVEYVNENDNKSYKRDLFVATFRNPKYTMEEKDGTVVNPITGTEVKEEVTTKESTESEEEIMEKLEERFRASVKQAQELLDSKKLVGPTAPGFGIMEEVYEHPEKVKKETEITKA